MAILLAAGAGTRLRPLTDSVPKCLLKIVDLSFLERSINSLVKVGVREFRIVVGYRGAQVKELVRQRYDRLKFYLIENEHYHESNTAYSLLLSLDGVSDSFFLIDGDVLYDEQLLIDLASQGAESVFVIDPDRSALDEEAVKVTLDKDMQRIGRIGKGISIPEAHGEFIGMSKISGPWGRRVYKRLREIMTKKENFGLYYEDVINELIDLEGPLVALTTGQNRWAEVDTIEDYQRAQNLWRG